MPITQDSGRQWPLTARVDFGYSDLTSGSDDVALTLPGGATVIGGELMLDTAFNSATSDVATIGDAGSATRYLSSTSIAATGRTALALSGYTTTAPTDVNVSWTGVGAVPTAGAGTLTVTYVLAGRSNENG